MIESKGHKITPIDGDLAVSRNAEIGGDADIHGRARVAGSLKVEGFLDAPNIKGAVIGLFATEEELKREYPNPRPGWCAIVLADKRRGFLYLAKNRGWEKQSEEAQPFDFIVDSINVFASKGELADETQRAQGAENILTQRIVNETGRAKEAENEIKKNAVKFNRISITGSADKLELMAATIDGDEVHYIDIPAATEERAGVVSAEDKKKIAKSITWNNDTDPSNMNDFVVAGVYDIKGERTRVNDNLPILNTGGGHSFNARLTVLDSSISGSGKDDDKCITQVLSFSNRLGQGEVYIRTGKGSSLDSLTWEKWSTLQRNVNVDTVTSLDDLVDNGIYSGVYVKNDGNIETFVMVVINNYALAGINNLPKSISQFKYSVSLGGSFAKYETRVGTGENDWGDWEILNKGEITSMISAEIKKVNDRISTLIDDNDPDTLDSIKDLVNWVNAHGADATAMLLNIQQNTVKINAEVNRATKKEQEIENNLDDEIERSVAADQDLLSNIDEEARRATQAEGEINQNTIAADSMSYSTTTDDISLEFETLDGKSTGSVTIPAATTEKAGIMSAEDKVKLNASIQNVYVAPGTDDVELDLEDNTDKITHVVFPAATEENAGVMTAEDKKTLDNVANAPNLALRALFIAAGAEYNDSGVDKTKTAPWGETVTHKAGHYYLNGLGDITEEQMLMIYNEGKFWVSDDCSGFGAERIRTNLPPIHWTYYYYKTYRAITLFNSMTIEVAVLGNPKYPIKVSDIRYTTQSAIKLKRVIGTIDISNAVSNNAVFINGDALEFINLKGAKTNVTLKCTVIDKSSVLYCIQNAAPTSAITIALHANAYARLKEDADIVSALTAQPLITLVSA